jgi:peptidoglycan/LPS O-acetylase OafA/YrhL
MFLILSVFVGRQGMQPFDPRFYLSMIGFRATPEMMYYFAPAWWYIGLIIQLYLVFPLLAARLRKMKPIRFLSLVLGVSFFFRLLGLIAFDQYLDAWSRGGVFITRLPEFAFGMVVAWWAHERPETTDRFLRSPFTLVVASVVYVFATGLALTLWGMTIAPFLQGVAVFVWLYWGFQTFSRQDGRTWRLLLWLGVHSYSLYLTHHPVIGFLLDRKAAPTYADSLLGVLAFVVGIGSALFLERIVANGQRLLGGWFERFGVGWVVARFGTLAAAITAILLGADVLIRTLDPQETNGWGERPSLQAHDKFGWQLIPDKTTRLRWESYDYVVSANELGFPGPLYSQHRSPGTLRIMTLGDAFTSAEGVDTEQSWPRKLERDLRERLQSTSVEVLNFAVTGYGPNQYAAVFEEFGPRYLPDVVVVGFFVNEYSDVLISNEKFQSAIGFRLRKQDSIATYFEAAHLRRWIQLNITERLRELATGRPRSHGFFLGNFSSLKTHASATTNEGSELVRERLAKMKQDADAIDAQLILALIPAPVQVCGPEDLVYYPSSTNLGDTKEFDLDLPQRLSQQIAGDLGLVVYDLRDPLQAAEVCPYQPRNMHWLPSGHDVVAEYLGENLTRDGHLNSTYAAKGSSR